MILYFIQGDVTHSNEFFKILEHFSPNLHIITGLLIIMPWNLKNFKAAYDLFLKIYTGIKPQKRPQFGKICCL